MIQTVTTWRLAKNQRSSGNLARLFRLHAHDGRLRSLPPELVWRSALRALTPRNTDRSS
jgi:hypothetical protein